MQIFNKTNFCMLIMGFGKSADIAENNVGSDVELAVEDIRKMAKISYTP